MKATYGQIQEDKELLELCRQLYAYVTATSSPLWDLESFDRLMVVDQSGQESFLESAAVKGIYAVWAGRNLPPDSSLAIRTQCKDVSKCFFFF
jgi:hypothetical protein